MRIAFFTETFLPRTDGIVTRLLRTLEQLSRLGDDALIIAPNMPDLPKDYKGAQVIGLPSVPFLPYPGLRLGSPALSPTSYAALSAFAPDLVHTVNPFSTGVGALLTAQRLHIPLVASYHTHIATYAHRYHLGWLDNAAWSYLRTLHNRADLNLCTSHPVEAELQHHGFQRLALWEPGVDADLFHPRRRSQQWRQRLTAGDPNATIILSVGRLAKEKGLDRLLPTLNALPGCHLAFVGSGPADAELRAAFANTPTTFLGPLHGADLAAAYAAADIFVLPSSTETLGLVAIEAMAAGLPVVGARHGGIPDIILDGVTGFLFDPDTPGDLTRALQRLTTSPVARRRMGHAARQRAAAWDWATTTAGLREQYIRLCANQRSASRSWRSVSA